MPAPTPNGLSPMPTIRQSDGFKEAGFRCVGFVAIRTWFLWLYFAFRRLTYGSWVSEGDRVI